MFAGDVQSSNARLEPDKTVQLSRNLVSLIHSHGYTAANPSSTISHFQAHYLIHYFNFNIVMAIIFMKIIFFVAERCLCCNAAYNFRPYGELSWPSEYSCFFSKRGQ